MSNIIASAWPRASDLEAAREGLVSGCNSDMVGSSVWIGVFGPTKCEDNDTMQEGQSWSTDSNRLTMFPSEHVFRRGVRLLGPAGVFVIGMFIYVLVPVVTTQAKGTLTISRGLLSPENHYIFVLPLLFAAIAYYHQEAEGLLDTFVRRGIFVAPAMSPQDGRASVRELIQRLVKDVSETRLSRWSAYIPWGVGIVTPAAFLLNAARPEWYQTYISRGPHTEGWLVGPDSHVFLITYVFSFAFQGIGIAVLCAWAISHLRAARVLEHLFGARSPVDVNLQLLHPDDCMGLHPISELVTHSAFVLVLLSFILFLWAIGFARVDEGVSILRNVGFVLAWAAYTSFAPILFFRPLVSARRRMLDLKERALAAFGQYVNTAADFEDVSKYAEQYRLIQRARVWPFTVTTVSSFVGSVAGPLVVAVLSEFITSSFG